MVVKALELPRASSGDLGQMVGFELERHVPFPPEEARFSWIELPSGADESRRLLVVAGGRRAVERPLGLLAGVKRRPAAITVACHELPALLPRALPARRAVWAHRHGTRTDLLLLMGRTLLMSRSVAVTDPAGLAREIQRSLPLVSWSHCEAVWISGDDAADWIAAPELAAVLDAPVSAPPYAARSGALVASLPAEADGAALLALGLALGSRRPALDLLPVELRPWSLSRAQLVTAGIASVTALLGLALAFAHVERTERYLGRLTEEIRRLDPEVSAVDAQAAERTRSRRVLAGLESVQRASLPGAAAPARAHGSAAGHRLAPGLEHGPRRRRAHRASRCREPAHPPARSLTLARARRVHLTGDQAAGQGAVPPPGGVGNPAGVAARPGALA